MGETMPTEDSDFEEFMIEVSKEFKKLWNKYNNLSESSKRKFLQYIEPMVRAGGTQGFINQMNLLFNTGKRY